MDVLFCKADKRDNGQVVLNVKLKAKEKIDFFWIKTTIKGKTFIGEKVIRKISYPMICGQWCYLRICIYLGKNSNGTVCVSLGTKKAFSAFQTVYQDTVRCGNTISNKRIEVDCDVIVEKEWAEREQECDFSWDVWNNRIETMAMHIDPNAESIIDLGAGSEYLSTLINDRIRYIPVDYTKRTERTVICDFNKQKMPDLEADCVFASGVLEYADDIETLVNDICSIAKKQIITSYSYEENANSLNFRQSRGWKNCLNIRSFTELFTRNGFGVKLQDGSISVFCRLEEKK